MRIQLAVALLTFSSQACSPRPSIVQSVQPLLDSATVASLAAAELNRAGHIGSRDVTVDLFERICDNVIVGITEARPPTRAIADAQGYVYVAASFGGNGTLRVLPDSTVRLLAAHDWVPPKYAPHVGDIAFLDSTDVVTLAVDALIQRGGLSSRDVVVRMFERVCDNVVIALERKLHLGVRTPWEGGLVRVRPERTVKLLEIYGGALPE